MTYHKRTIMWQTIFLIKLCTAQSLSLQSKKSVMSNLDSLLLLLLWHNLSHPTKSGIHKSISLQLLWNFTPSVRGIIGQSLSPLNPLFSKSNSIDGLLLLLLGRSRMLLLGISWLRRRSPFLSMFFIPFYSVSLEASRNATSYLLVASKPCSHAHTKA